MQTLYDNVKNTELYSPLSRSWYEEGFNEYDLTMCNIKSSSVPKDQSKKVSQYEFVNCADLTEKSLFNFNNEIDAIDQNDKNDLICGAFKIIMQKLSNSFLKHKHQPINSKVCSQIFKTTLDINKDLHCTDQNDAILRAVYNLNPKNTGIITEILSNCTTGSKTSVTLIP